MKKAIIWTMLIMSAFLFEGCGGKSQSIYIVKPTPLKKESSKYYVKDLKVTLFNGGFGQNLENKSFLDEQHLKDEFAQYLNKSLKDKGLLGNQDDFGLSIEIAYERVFHLGGNALLKPIVNHHYKIYDKESNLLVSDGLSQYTTKYAYLEELAVSIESLAMQWDAEDEPRDVEMISSLLIDDISRVGN